MVIIQKRLQGLVGLLSELNNGIVFQYGFAVNRSNAAIVTYPIAFSSCRAIVISTINYTTTIGARNNVNFKITCMNTTNIDWIAIGWI